MRRRRSALAVLALLLLLGCRHTYGFDQQMAGGTIPASSSVYVALPASASFGDKLYAESGRQTGEALARGFAPHVRAVELGAQPEDPESALETARARQADYLVHALIEHWEDRVTVWSAMPDRIQLLVRLYETKSGRLLNASTVTGTSRWMDPGGDRPQHMVEPGLEPWFEALFPND